MSSRSPSWITFDRFAAENAKRIMIPADRTYPLDREAMDQWLGRLATSHVALADRATGWTREAESIRNPARKKATLEALALHGVANLDELALARQFVTRAQHVPFSDFRVAVEALADEVVARCKRMPENTRVVLVLPDKVLKSSTWMAQLLWLNRGFANCVTDVVSTPKDAMLMAADTPILVVHPDDASYSGGQLADSIRIRALWTMYKHGRAHAAPFRQAARAALAALTKAGEGATDALRANYAAARTEAGRRRVVYFFAVPYMGAQAKEKIIQVASVTTSGGKRGQGPMAKLSKRYLMFPSETHEEVMEHLVPFVPEEVEDDDEDDEDEEEEDDDEDDDDSSRLSNDSLAFGGALAGNQVPVYFDQKFADHTSIPTTIFSGAPSIERLGEGVFSLRSTLLIGSGHCSPANYRYHGRRAPPGVLVEDYDQGGVCPRAYYKTIGYTSDGFPLDTNLNALDALLNIGSMKGALAAERAHVVLARSIPHAHDRAVVLYEPDQAPLGRKTVVRAMIRASAAAAEDFDFMLKKFGVMLAMLRGASVAPDVMFDAQRALIRSVYMNDNFSAEHVVAAPYLQWLLANAEDGPIPTRSVAPEHYTVMGSGKSATVRPSETHPLAAVQRVDSDFGFRVAWSPSLDEDEDANADGGHASQVEVYSHPGDTPRIAAAIDVVAGTMSSHLFISPFWSGSARAFQLDPTGATAAVSLALRPFLTPSRPSQRPKGFYTITEQANVPRTVTPTNPDDVAWNARVALLAGVYGLAAAYATNGYQHNAPLDVAFAEYPDGPDDAPDTLLVLRLTGDETGVTGVFSVPPGRSNGKASLFPLLRTHDGSSTNKYTHNARIESKEQLWAPVGFLTFYARSSFIARDDNTVQAIMELDPVAFLQTRTPAKGWQSRAKAPSRTIATDFYTLATRTLYAVWLKDKSAERSWFDIIYTDALAALPVEHTMRRRRITAGFAVTATLLNLIHGAWPSDESADSSDEHFFAKWLLRPQNGYVHKTVQNSTSYRRLVFSFDAFATANTQLVSALRALMHSNPHDRLAWVASSQLAEMNMFADDSIRDSMRRGESQWNTYDVIPAEVTRRAYFLDVTRILS